jgi:hypothetical protein
MIRVSLTNAFAKRTLKPQLEKHQATPLGVNLASGQGEIYSGMVASLTVEGPGTTGVVQIASDASGVSGDDSVFGLFALDKNITINDLDGQPADLSPFAVWQGGPDAYFRVYSNEDPLGAAVGGLGGFDIRDTYAVGDALFVTDNGQLGTGTTSTVGTVAVAQVTEVISSTSLVIRLDTPAPLA